MPSVAGLAGAPQGRRSCSPVEVLGARPHPQHLVHLLVDPGPAALQVAMLCLRLGVTAL